MQSPKLATPKETAPNNRTARARAPDSITYNKITHTSWGPRAPRSGGGGPRGGGPRGPRRGDWSRARSC